MPITNWKPRLRTVVRENPWWTYRLDTVELPSGKQVEYHYVHTRGSAIAVPVTAEGKLLLVRQYRYPQDRESVEFPGGGVKEGASAEQTARAELAEETGWRAAVWQNVGSFNPFNGVTDEMCQVFVARGLEPAPDAKPDDTEEFELVELTIDELEQAIRGGTLWDGMTMAAWLLARGAVGSAD